MNIRNFKISTTGSLSAVTLSDLDITLIHPSLNQDLLNEPYTLAYDEIIGSDSLYEALKNGYLESVNEDDITVNIVSPTSFKGFFMETFEENGLISTATNSGEHWAMGNGAELTGSNGLEIPVDCTLLRVSGTRNTGFFTVEIYRNQIATGIEITISGNTDNTVELPTPLNLLKGDVIKLRTTVVNGSTIGTVSLLFGVSETIPLGSSINSANDVNISGISSGQTLTWNGNELVPTNGSTDSESVTNISKGSTLGLQQELLALQGQVGKTVLAVGFTYYQGVAAPTANHKAQCTSLGNGNVAFLYATGDDFNNNIIQEGPIFLEKGEIYIFENVQNGSIITFTEGGYGFSQQRNNNDESPMPLLSFALSFTDTFVFAFRNSASNEGRIHVVNGPIVSEVTIQTGAGGDVLGQNNILLQPWEYREFFTNGNGEYRILSTNKIMACINANMDVPSFYDSRLILPLTNDGITWPRSGFLSAPFNNTIVRSYVNDNTSNGTIATATVNPGTPIDYDGNTAATDQDYEPRGATRSIASGLFTAFSGADSAGLEASPICPVSTFTQRIALPLYIRNAGDGGNNGIALASCYVGTAKLYQWNSVSGVAELVTVNDPSGTPTTEIKLIRRNGNTEFNVTTRQQQLYPSSALISAQGAGGTDANAYDFITDFTGGYIEVDVPSICVFNSEQNANGGTSDTYRGTSGPSVIGIHSDDDEQLTYGISPETIRSEIREDTSGILRKRIINNTGTETWIIA